MVEGGCQVINANESLPGKSLAEETHWHLLPDLRDIHPRDLSYLIQKTNVFVILILLILKDPGSRFNWLVSLVSVLGHQDLTVCTEV